MQLVWNQILDPETVAYLSAADDASIENPNFATQITQSILG